MQLFAKILAFDRNLASRAGDHIVLGILYQHTFRSSSQTKDEVIRSMSAAGITSIGGKTVSVEVIDLEDAVDVGAVLEAKKVSLAYITPLRAFDVGSILDATQREKILTLTGVSGYAERGVSIAIGMKNQRPEIVINLPSARTEGAEFNSHFLKLVRVLQ
jgi:hypothetical protein